MGELVRTAGAGQALTSECERGHRCLTPAQPIRAAYDPVGRVPILFVGSANRRRHHHDYRALAPDLGAIPHGMRRKHRGVAKFFENGSKFLTLHLMLPIPMRYAQKTPRRLPCL